ncbi:serine hydrolase domain-containing protein [Paraglaciecola sp.]|uniref:serine hydrolase domain-containing protein n=1 Tax=Paraglaciecola sp. TaxID=1920173 RepID=UPI003EF8E546
MSKFKDRMMKSVLENPSVWVTQLIIKLVTLYFLVTATACASTVPNDLEKRLTALSLALETQRVEHHIPGMAMAIVKDGKVILSKGFGLANIKEKKPVTPKSIFAIGSTTKAFTATLTGMLVDENKLDWDTLLTEYLPDYQFKQKGKSLDITLRDALSHRSGYARNDILWVNGLVTRKEILKDATQAQKWSPFRKKFNYNNVMYLAAGMATAKRAETNWDSLLESRIIKPLLMKNTSADLEKAQSSNLLATGYMWQEELGHHKLLPMRNLTNIGPAGSVNSNVEDMSQWLKFQLANGTFNGKRLISEDVLLETRKPQIKMAKDMFYGLGWMLRKWQGQTVVEHGGNIDGYAAQVTLFPESNLGYVLLTNVTATPLQQLSINLVASHLLAKPKSATTNNPIKQDFGKYTGEYIANFGPFKNAIFSILEKEGKLAVDVPGQTTYVLNPPNKQGKWVFELTDTIAVSFDKNKQGQITALRMHQNGMNFELPKKGMPIIPEISPAELQKYLGSYYSKHLKSNSTAIIQNHRLAIDVPGQMVYELHLPNESGEWKFRINPNMHVTFDKDDNNKVVKLNFYRDGIQNGAMPRVEDKNETPLPTVKEILTLRNTQKQRKALIEARGIESKGSVFLAQAGITAKFESFNLADTHVRYNMDLGKYGLIEVAVSPTEGATKQSFSPFTPMLGKYLKQGQKSYPMIDLDWSSFYQDIEVVKRTEWQNKPVYMVLLKNADVPPVTAYIDTKTGDLLKLESSVLLAGIGAMPYSLEFEDYQEIDGLRLAHKIISKDNQRGKLVFDYASIKTQQNTEEETFKLTE